MSTKQHIIMYLKVHGGFVSGSKLESNAEDWRTKASVISRRCRELANEGQIERTLSDRRTVQYRLFRMNTNVANDYLKMLEREEKINQEILL